MLAICDMSADCKLMTNKWKNCTLLVATKPKEEAACDDLPIT